MNRMNILLIMLISIFALSVLLFTACDVQKDDSPTIEEVVAEGLVYTLCDDGASYQLEGTEDMTISELVVESTIKGKSVTAIAEYAFEDCTSIDTIVLPSSITSIGDYAFSNCSYIADVYYDGSIADWCGISFDKATANPMWYADNCYMLDDSGDYCLVTEIVIPDNVTSIGKYQFVHIADITDVIIGDSVTSIGAFAFSKCTSLTSLTIGSAVVSIGDNAFSGCTGLTSIELPDSVVSLGVSAFFLCGNLANVTMSNSVVDIGVFAFGDCTSLTSITIPASVVNIDECAFYNCTNLTSVVFEDASTWYYTQDPSRARNMTGGTSLTIPDPTTAATYLASTYYGYYWYKA